MLSFMEQKKVGSAGREKKTFYLHAMFAIANSVDKSTVLINSMYYLISHLPIGFFDAEVIRYCGIPSGLLACQVLAKQCSASSSIRWAKWIVYKRDCRLFSPPFNINRPPLAENLANSKTGRLASPRLVGTALTSQSWALARCKTPHICISNCCLTIDLLLW